jgi:hypothetical protein
VFGPRCVIPKSRAFTRGARDLAWRAPKLWECSAVTDTQRRIVAIFSLDPRKIPPSAELRRGRDLACSSGVHTACPHVKVHPSERTFAPPEEAEKRARAIVKATTHYNDPKVLLEVGEDLVGADEAPGHLLFSV